MVKEATHPSQNFNTLLVSETITYNTDIVDLVHFYCPQTDSFFQNWLNVVKSSILNETGHLELVIIYNRVLYFSKISKHFFKNHKQKHSAWFILTRRWSVFGSDCFNPNCFNFFFDQSFQSFLAAWYWANFNRPLKIVCAGQMEDGVKEFAPKLAILAKLSSKDISAIDGVLVYYSRSLFMHSIDTLSRSGRLKPVACHDEAVNLIARLKVSISFRWFLTM